MLAGILRFTIIVLRKIVCIVTPSTRQWFWKFLAPRYWPIWLGLGLMKLMAALPFSWQLVLGGQIGRWIGKVARRRRRIAEINLELCFPELSPTQRAALLEAHFAALGTGLFETAMAWWAPDDKLRGLAQIKGLEHLQQALDRGKASDALLEQASDLLARPELDDRDRALLGYELGKALDGRQRYPEAMARWHDANAARRRMTGAPDLAEHDRQADRLIAATTPARLPAPGRWPGNQDPRPVWVVGMPRSGTTLTEQLLAAHPGVHGCGDQQQRGIVAHPGGSLTCL